jgi:hypothetical protein
VRRAGLPVVLISFVALVAGCGSSSSKPAASTVASGGGAPAAESSLVVFRTPGNDIHCGSYPASGGSPAYLRCNVLGGMKPLPEKTCRAGDPGLGVDMLATGRSEAPCFGDPGPDAVFKQSHPFVLAYGDIWRRNGFSCVSQSSGLTCRNRSGHGFTLKGRSWRLL